MDLVPRILETSQSRRVWFDNLSNLVFDPHNGVRTVYANPARGTNLLEILYCIAKRTAIMREGAAAAKVSHRTLQADRRRHLKLVRKGYKVIFSRQPGEWSQREVPKDWHALQLRWRARLRTNTLESNRAQELATNKHRMQGERLYPLVANCFVELYNGHSTNATPGLVTGMLLSLESAEVERILESPGELAVKVGEAVQMHMLLQSTSDRAYSSDSNYEEGEEQRTKPTAAFEPPTAAEYAEEEV